MNSFLKYISILLLIVFSFYYTDKISNIIIFRSELMKAIQNSKNSYEKKSVDAIILGNSIIPGVNGLVINELDSYYNMKPFNSFLEKKLIFKEVSPTISIENNNNLNISKGNSLKKAVAIIIENNDMLLSYSKENNIQITHLIDYYSFDKKSVYEQINNDSINYDKLNNLLDNYGLNTNICIINKYNKCENAKYKVSIKTTFNNSNITMKNNIFSGDIIYIEDNLSLNNYKLLLKEIKYRDLKVMFLSQLISEKRI